MLDEFKKCGEALKQKGFSEEAQFFEELAEGKATFWAVTFVEGGYDEHYGIDPKSSRLFRTEAEALAGVALANAHFVRHEAMSDLKWELEYNDTGQVSEKAITSQVQQITGNKGYKYPYDKWNFLPPETTDEQITQILAWLKFSKFEVKKFMIPIGAQDG